MRLDLPCFYYESGSHMANQDWFRRSAWTDHDREEFNARLHRSRGAGNKAQYLRIQAFHLADAGLHAAAIELLDRLFAEFPERIQLASAHQQKAEALAGLGQTEPAIHEFRAALQAERDFQNVKTQAWLDFAWFAVENQRTDLYDEVSHVLAEFRDKSGLSFPKIEYRYWAVLSLIADSRGEGMVAREYATLALKEASKTHSGLRYHPTVGLVSSQPDWMEKKLRALAGSL
ncbi:MAG: hypothetical protein ACLQNE_45780 [Thermoguttaceae bacterium]